MLALIPIPVFLFISKEYDEHLQLNTLLITLEQSVISVRNRLINKYSLASFGNTVVLDRCLER